MWNRQPTSHDLIDPVNTGLGHRQVQRWTLPDGWIISARLAHPALVSEQDVIVFTSCAFVPLRSLPGPLQAVGATSP